MASVIRIKRSLVSGNPATLAAGELAYSALEDNGSNGGSRLYIGIGTETAGNAANHFVIGGTYFTDMLDHSKGTLTASSALVTDVNSKLDNIKVDNLDLNGNTISTTDVNGNLLLTPNGTGKTIITNPYIGTDAVSLAEYIYDTVGGAITAGTGITITNSDVNDTSIVSITNTGVTAGSYGGATSIPILTINAQGQVTAASTASVASTLNISGDSGTDGIALLSETLSFVGGTGITSSVTANTVTFDIDSTVATLTGTQTLTNKTINLANNTLVSTSAQLASAITDETGSGSLVFATSPSLITPVLGVASATSINKVTITAPATSATLTIANGKTLTANNTLTFTGTDGSSVAFNSGGTVAYVANKLSAFAATTSAELAGVITDETGSGSLVFATSPTLITPTLGAALATSVTATSGNLTVAAAAGNNSVNLTPTGTGTVDVASKRITNVAEPSQATDAATKNYVDAVKTGLVVKDSARLATTANLTVTYNNGTSGVGATLTNSGTLAALTLDSVPAVVGDRILVKDQTTALQNGIYTVTNIGSPTVAWVLTRATDFDNNPAGEIEGGDFTFVQEGTNNADNGYVVTTNGEITVGTTAITWVQFSGAGSVIAGAGLTKTGNTLDVIGTTNRITVTADAVDIASTYVGQSTITTLGTISSGVWQGTIVGPTYGGTGVNNGTKTITLGGNLITSGAFNTTLTATANTNVTLPATGTLATLAGAEALTNKTVNGLNITTTTGTLTVVSGGTLATAGAFSTTLTSTGTTNVTLPTTGTLATLAGTESLSNKTITASSFAGSVAATTLSASGATTLTAGTASTSTATGTLVVTGGVGISGAVFVGTNITGSGAATSTLDGFNIDGGTY